MDLRSRREELGLTLEQVGDACNVGKSTVRKWETGMIRNMRRDKVAMLAKVLRVNPMDIIASTDDVPMERTTRADTDERVLTAYHGAEEVYQTIALELLESHQKERNVPDQDGRG